VAMGFFDFSFMGWQHGSVVGSGSRALFERAGGPGPCRWSCCTPRVARAGKKAS
jgi:hypothetical protein